MRMAETGSSRSCPYDRANVFSKITFWWMNALFKLGFKNQLTSMNICDVSREDESSSLEARLDRLWKKEVQRFSEGQSANLFRAVLKAFKWQWILPGFMVIGFESIKLVQPFFIGLLVSFFNNEEDAVSPNIAYIVGASLGISALMQVCLNPTYFFVMQHVALRMKVAVGALIYRKVLSLSSEAFQSTSAGQIVNYLSTDVEKFNMCIDLLHYMWAAPLSLCAVTYLVYRQVGLVGLWGVGFVILAVGIQTGLSTLVGKLRYRIGAISDQRIQLMSEVILAMRVIKLHCWERPFQILISKLRSWMPVLTPTFLICPHFGGWARINDVGSEASLLRWAAIAQSLDTSLETLSARLATLAVMLSLWYDGRCRPADAFTTLLWLYVLHGSLLKFPFQLLHGLKNMYNSTHLVQTFLLLDEEKEQIKDLRLHRSISYRKEPHSDWAIDIDHMTARWPVVYTDRRRRFQKKRQRSSTSSMKSLLHHDSDADHSFSLKYVSLQVKKGELLAVVGVVGAGKSSLLMSLIGELPHEIGQISINGGVSYCSQTSWVFSGSVRDNILFGHQFNRSHYQNVIQACGLSRDNELFPQGDLTFVGERGLHLSGGQKARISLARCVYHDADIYLLDDPLSAVDANVGRHIFQWCIQDLLKEKTVVLVTHQVQYLKQADRILVLREGSIHDIGTYDELKSRGMDMRALTSIDHPKHATDAAIEAEEEETQILLESKSVGVEEEEEKGEHINTGSVSFRVYWNYFCAGFGPALLIILVPAWLASPALICLSDWMLSKWVGESSMRQAGATVNTVGTSPATGLPASDGSGGDNMTSSMELYIIALASSAASYLLFAFVFLQMAATASQRLHDKILKHVINATCWFFETHPVGQILNRFSRDFGFIDNTIPMLSYVVVKLFAYFVGLFVVTVVVNPWLIIAMVPMMVCIVLIRMYAVQTLRQIKRLETRARSPVYSHVSETILGLETVRALRKKDQFLSEFDSLQNSHTSAWFLYLSSYRWMSVRTLLVVVLYLNIIIFVSLSLKESLDGNQLALSLLYCIAILEPFEFTIRISADLETQMTSVERVLGYCDIEQEPPRTSDKPPPPEWPNRGAITFTKMSLKYSQEAPMTLKNIECHIKGKEKIGIVGRTGSGKSSLISALFRLAKPTGFIYIDAVDTSKLGLQELRSKMSVIPQDPVLFSRTLRWNLDPLDEFSDERLWNALEQVQLKAKVDQMPGKLYSDIQEDGQNLSVGERQLVCLARAILKYHRILVLDEATASVDQETDNIIQRTIRAKFRDSTVLTVAHRLFTIMDCDRIMVLEDGELKEFDTPYNLLQNSEGVFTRLVLNTGKNQAKQLQALAELSQHRRTSASLNLQRAVLLANEQLAQSSEDLSAGKAALDWNRFTHSQDSLDKAAFEAIVEKEKKTVGPSQRIIRRRSPGRTKRTIEEEEELLSYDAPPKVHSQVTSASKDSPSESPSRRREDRANNEPKTADSPSSDTRRRNREETSGYDRHIDLTRDENEGRSRGRNGRHEIVETDIDSPLEAQVVKGKNPGNGSSGVHDSKNMRTSSPISRSGERSKVTRSDVRESGQTSPIRVLSGNYIPLAQQEGEKEQFV